MYDVQVKKIIGLVEDDQTIATVVSSLLEEEGYQVVRMSMAEELFRFFRDRTADLILLDYRLPDMEGKDLLRKLRPQEKAPVIVISADHSVKEVSLQAGAQDFIGKPFDIEILLSAIRKYIT